MIICGFFVKDVLRGRRFIFVGKKFFFVDRVVLEMKTDCSLYFYKFLDYLVDGYWKLMNFVGVRE